MTVRFAEVDGVKWVDHELERREREYVPAPRPKPSPVGTVYVAEVAGGRIKIGFTKKPVESRLRQIGDAVGMEVRLLVSLEGTRDLESQLHDRFAPYRLHGEWFEDCAEIRAWAQEVA